MLAYFLKPREGGLSVGLWVPERRAERALMEDDGITPPEDAWLACTTKVACTITGVVLGLNALFSGFWHR